MACIFVCRVYLEGDPAGFSYICRKKSFPSSKHHVLYSLRNEKWNTGLGCFVACERHMKHLPWAVLVWQKMARNWLKLAEKLALFCCLFQPFSCHFLPNQDSPRQVFHMTFTNNKAAQANVSHGVLQSVMHKSQIFLHKCIPFEWIWLK